MDLSKYSETDLAQLAGLPLPEGAVWPDGIGERIVAASVAVAEAAVVERVERFDKIAEKLGGDVAETLLGKRPKTKNNNGNGKR